MYVPDMFKLEDPMRIAQVLGHFNFGLLISAANGKAPIATHLPFLYDAARGPHGTLTAHMARANPHWKDFAALAEANGEVLAVFSGPHAYISPSWYGPGDAVPTWNYVAVHAYGTPRLMDDAAVRPMLEELVATHEAGAAEPWSLSGNDEKFLAGMQRGIVAFEIPVARLEAKAKLSQNKTPEVHARVTSALREAGGETGGETGGGEAGNSEATALAEWMEALAPSG